MLLLCTASPDRPGSGPRSSLLGLFNLTAVQQKYKNTKIQECVSRLSPGTALCVQQKYKNTKLQKHKNTEIQECVSRLSPGAALCEDRDAVGVWAWVWALCHTELLGQLFPQRTRLHSLAAAAADREQPLGRVWLRCLCSLPWQRQS